MSWYDGMTNISLKGFRTADITISKDDINELGVIYPFLIDLRSSLDVVLGGKTKDIIGSGNYDLINDQFYDFMFESFIWPNLETKHDMKLLSHSKDISFLVGIGVLSITTKNDYTDRETERDNVILFFSHPDFNDKDAKLQIYLGGFFSPVQELIMSNFNETANHSLFHEIIHAIKRSGDDLLKDIMYGGSAEVVTEEIMTHLFTDKFKSFLKLDQLLYDDLRVSTHVEDSLANPIGLTLNKNSINKSEGPGLSMMMNHIRLNSKSQFKVKKNHYSYPVIRDKDKKSSLVIATNSIRNKYSSKLMKSDNKSNSDDLKSDIRSMFVKRRLMSKNKTII